MIGQASIVSTVTLVCIGLNALLSWNFILHMELGIVGIGLANFLTSVLSFSTLLVYTNYFIPEVKEAI